MWPPGQLSQLVQSLSLPEQLLQNGGIRTGCAQVFYQLLPLVEDRIGMHQTNPVAVVAGDLHGVREVLDPLLTQGHHFSLFDFGELFVPTATIAKP